MHNDPQTWKLLTKLAEEHTRQVNEALLAQYRNSLFRRLLTEDDPQEAE